MAEQKKDFGIVLKSAKTKKQKEEKKLYTIVSCCVSAIFLITIFVPFLTNGEEKSSGSAYKNVSFDLADLATDDEAEKVLLEMNKYSDIPKQKVFGGLFTKKQKEERQEVDKKQGLPPAADSEYLEARKQKQSKRTRGVSRTPVYTQRQITKTPTGTMTKGGMVSTSGGSSGVSTSIWTSQDKAGQKGTSNTKGSTGSFGTQQLVAATGAKGRASGLLRAIEESQKGANSQSADVAAQAAADAFTNNNIEAEDDDLKDGMDELAEKFNADELKKLGNDKDLTDLQNEIEKEKEKQEDEADPCKSKKKELRMQCLREKILEQVITGLIDLAKSAASSAINAAISNGVNSGGEGGKGGKNGNNGGKGGKNGDNGGKGGKNNKIDKKIDKTKVFKV